MKKITSLILRGHIILLLLQIDITDRATLTDSAPDARQYHYAFNYCSIIVVIGFW